MRALIQLRRVPHAQGDLLTALFGAKEKDVTLHLGVGVMSPASERGSLPSTAPPTTLAAACADQVAARPPSPPRRRKPAGAAAKEAGAAEAAESGGARGAAAEPDGVREAAAVAARRRTCWRRVGSTCATGRRWCGRRRPRGSSRSLTKAQYAQHMGGATTDSRGAARTPRRLKRARTQELAARLVEPATRRVASASWVSW